MAYPAMGIADPKIEVPSAENLEDIRVTLSESSHNTALGASSSAGHSAFLISAFPSHSTSFSPNLFKFKLTCLEINEADFYS